MAEGQKIPSKTNRRLFSRQLSFSAYLLLVALLVLRPLLANNDDQVGVYSWGSTGIIGQIIKRPSGNAIRVLALLKNSPSEKHLVRGDLILGLNGQLFSKKERLLKVMASAIDATEASPHGSLSLTVHKTYTQNQENSNHQSHVLDAKRLFLDDSTQDSWTPGEERSKLWRAPLLPKISDDLTIHKHERAIVTLSLTPLGRYSSTHPLNCTKTEIITENALNDIRDSVRRYPGQMGKRFLLAHILLGSGSDEDLNLVRSFVRSSKAFSPQRIINRLHPRGAQIYGRECLFAAQYYLQTNDAYIRDSLYELATAIAEGQSHGGSWGPRVMTDLEGRAFLPGVDNLTGGICSLSLVMTMRSGIQSPAITEAISRSEKYYETLYQRGGTPIGFQRASSRIVTQGRDGVSAMVMAMMGKKTEADYFAKRSLLESLNHDKSDPAVSSLIWSTLATAQIGDQANAKYLQDLQLWRTLSRRHDGGFFLQRPQGGILSEKEATAIHLIPLLTTEKNNLLFSKESKNQFTGGERIEIDTAHRNDRLNWLKSMKTESLISSGNHFLPSFRKDVSQELGRRCQGQGGARVIRKLAKLLSDESPTMRATAASSLSACGKDALTTHQAKLKTLWLDPVHFVRTESIRAMAPLQPELHPTIAKPLVDLLLQPQSRNSGVEVNTVSDAILSLLFRPDPQTSTEKYLITNPLHFGMDQQRTRSVIERAFSWNPGRIRVIAAAHHWPNELIRLVMGPLTHAASVLPQNPEPLSMEARSLARQLLAKKGFTQELIESVGHNLISLRRRSRSQYQKTLHFSAWSGGLIEHHWLMKFPEHSKFLLKDLKKIYHRFPSIQTQRGTSFEKLLTTIQLASSQPDSDVFSNVLAQLKHQLRLLKDLTAKVNYCESLLDVDSTSIFLQMACLSSLVEIRDAKSISSLIPFLGHPHWRVRTHTLELIRTIGNRATLPLCQSFSSLNDSRIKAGIMEALTLLVDEKAFPTIFLVTVSEDSYVRREATKALFATTGLLHFERMLVLLKASTDEVVLSGLETALLKFQRETTEAQIISKALLKNLHETTPEAFGSFSYILAELGGWENLNALAQSVLSRKATFAQHALEALSLSPDAKANQHLIHTLEQSAGLSFAFQIGRMASRRLVMDAEDGGFLSDDERFTYAEKILAVVSEPTVLKLLGNFYGKDSTELLYSFLEQGTVEISDAALEGLISIALNLNKISSPNELDSTIEILRKAEVHLTEERFGVEDFLTGKPLFPKTQEQLSLLTASLQPYSNHENSSTP